MKKLQLLSLFLLAGICVSAQNPVQWSFSSKKIADKTFEISFNAKVQSPWHIYSQTTPDGGPLPTKFTFNKNPMILIEGLVEEKGKLQKKYEEVFEIDVKYFDGSVNFVQVVKLKNDIKTNLTGSLEYMVCNDTQCLPPSTVPFNIALK